MNFQVLILSKRNRQRTAEKKDNAVVTRIRQIF